MNERSLPNTRVQLQFMSGNCRSSAQHLRRSLDCRFSEQHCLLHCPHSVFTSQGFLGLPSFEPAVYGVLAPMASFSVEM